MSEIKKKRKSFRSFLSPATPLGGLPTLKAAGMTLKGVTVQQCDRQVFVPEPQRGLPLKNKKQGHLR